MKRHARWLGTVLLAACGGGADSTKFTGGTLGTTHDNSGIHSSGGGPAAVPVDPTLAFRLQFANPGGKWMPQQMTLPGHAELFKKLGVAIEAKTLADPLAAPLGAIVSLGGCSASFVSPEGLIVTNHHCVQNNLQVISAKAGKDYVKEGYLAATRADEMSGGAAQRVYVAQAITDVTKQMRDGLETIKDHVARKEEVEKRLKTIVAGCEKDRPGIRCNVSSFFRGGSYLLIENLELRDVRVVYVPSRSVGDYGGEKDNWAWPRHTGDFSFLRAYVGKDGKPADYSPDNVPFHPKHFLKVSIAGVEQGDFVMVAGYPGSTSRLDTASELRHTVEWFMPYFIDYMRERYKIAEELTKNPDKDTSRKAGTTKQFIQNTLENYEGKLKGLTKSSELIERKVALDAKIKEFVAKPGHEAQKQAIERLEAMIAEDQRTARLDFERGNTLRGSSLLSLGLSFTRWAEERVKPDADRKPGFQERDVRNATARQMQFKTSYDKTADRTFFRASLVRALKLPEAERPWLATLLDMKGKKIDEAAIDKTLDAWYGATTLEDEKLRIELLTKGTTTQLKASKDPFIKAAQRVWPLLKEQEKKDDADAGEMTLLTHHYADAMREVLGGQLAPDANGTLRISYGTVRSFKPDSKALADRPFTVATEIPAKNSGEEDFDLPKRTIDAIKSKKYGSYASKSLGGELPVCFLSDLDITGGNSGSATLNSKGEFVGLAFDGTLEGVASDLVWNGATTRTIHADARYMAWIMDHLDNADHILREMGITPNLDTAPGDGGASGPGKAGR